MFFICISSLIYIKINIIITFIDRLQTQPKMEHVLILTPIQLISLYLRII
jgi:hypothetical protein